MNYLVSILVPIYKVEQWIEKCATSLLRQSYENIEYVFVDDCSPDNSIDVLKNTIKRYPKRSSQCKIIRHVNNKGLSGARNTALNNANGVFVLHVDSDDWLETDAVSVLVQKQIETDADIVSGNALQHLPNHNISIQEPEYSDKYSMLQYVFDFHAPLNHTIWRRLIRKSIYTDNHLVLKEGVNQGEDFQMLPKLIYYAKRCEKVNQVVYNYNCLNVNSYMYNRKTNTNLWLQDIASYKIIESFFDDKELFLKQASVEAMIWDYYNYYLQAAKFGEKEIWLDIKKTIDRYDNHYHSIIGWNKPIKKLFISNYSFLGCFLRIRSMIYSFYLKKIKKS